MLCMLVVGAIGELIWMPALLAGPLGKYFEPLKPKTPAEPILATEAAPSHAHIAPPHSRPGGVLRKDTAH